MSTVLPAPDPVLGGRNPCLSGPLSQRPAHVGYLVGRLSKMCFQIESYGLVTDKYLIVTQYHKLQLYLTLPIQVSFADMGRNFYLEGLGILQIYEDIFLQVGFTHTAQFLTELAEDIMPVKLFGYISATQMQRSTRKWTLAFVSVMEDLREDTRVTVLL